MTGTLARPELQLFSSTGQVIAENSGWAGDPEIATVSNLVGAFSWGTLATADSALLLTLPPGAYTGQVSGIGGGTGIALVEVYDVP